MKRVRYCVSGSLIGFLVLAMLGLAGCHRYYIPESIDDTVYKLPRRVSGSSDAHVNRMVRSFNRSNTVKVLSIGSDYLITMPSAALFATQSPRLLWSAYPTLNKVVRFTQEFRKVAVTVTCYTSLYGSNRREHALALARARAVGDYFWSQGMDTRLIFTGGAGADKPITNYLGGDGAPSSRIEITFRDTLI